MRTITVDAVIDIECENWETFVMGGILRKNGVYRDYSWHEEAEYVADVLDVVGNVYAHFGGGYDHKHLVDWARHSHDIELSLTGNRIIKGKVDTGTNLLDSYALFPMSLDKLTSVFEVKKEKLGLPCVCKAKCEGYCSIRRDMAPADFERTREYMRKDIHSLMLALTRFKDFAAIHGLDLGMTLGGSSYRNMRLPPAELSKTEWDFIAQAKFGGRTQVFSHKHYDRAYMPDVTSMYPTIMKHELFPSGRPERPDDPMRAYQDGAAGFYTARVVVPPCEFPPLPVRGPTGNAYPTGEFVGTWAYPELLNAQQSGVKVAILDAMTFEVESPFGDWVDRLWAIRELVGKDTTFGAWVKLYLNSPSGKFGMNPWRDSYILSDKITPRACVCLCANCGGTPQCECGDVSDCWCGAPQPVSDGIWKIKEYVSHGDESQYAGDACCHLYWYCYITAYGRVMLHKAMRAMPPGTVIYCDTDCMVTTVPATHLEYGEKLGQWSPKDVSAFEAIGPKIYSYFDNGKSKLRAKAKGVTLHKAENGDPIPAKPGDYFERESGIIGVSVGAKLGKLFKRATITRVVSVTSGDRIRLDDMTTRAPTIEEVFTSKPIPGHTDENDT